jgi:hypothetical protein
LYLPYGSKRQLLLFSKKATVPLLAITDQSPLSILFQIFRFVIHDHVSHYLKFKISIYQYGFSNSKSAIISLVTYGDFISPLVGSLRQTDAIYFDQSNAFDLVPHSLLLHKLSAFGLSGAYVIWFRSYLSNTEISSPCFWHSFLTF